MEVLDTDEEMQAIVNALNGGRHGDAAARCRELLARSADARPSLKPAWLHTQLGSALVQGFLAGGAPPADLERGIAALRTALDLVTPLDDAPALFLAASTACMLGHATTQLPQPDAKGSDEARDAYCKGLAAIDRLEKVVDLPGLAFTVLPMLRGPALYALSQIHLERAQGGRVLEEEELAVHYLRRAVESSSREEWPGLWAEWQTELAAVYAQRRGGEPLQNTLEAVKCFDAALAVIDREAEPERWARAVFNKAQALLAATDRRERWAFELARQAVEDALACHSREAHPDEWAALMNDLSLVFARRGEARVQGGQDFELALACVEQALEIRTPAHDRDSWAASLANRAAIYLHRSDGTRAENVEHAIADLESALRVFGPVEHPDKWMMAQSNLALALLERTHDDRVESQERAVELLRSTLLVARKDRVPELWGLLQFNLGRAYTERLRGHPRENIGSAIAAFEEALRVRSRDAAPSLWADTQSNLGAAYARLGPHHENLEAARHCLEAALEIHTPAAAPLRWAQAYGNLGLVHAEGVLEGMAVGLRRAVRIFEEVLPMLDRDEAPLLWAQTALNLAMVESKLVTELGEGDEARAEHASLRAIEAYKELGLSPQLRQAAVNLGLLRAHRQRWEAAAEAFDHAIVASEHMYTAARVEEHKRVEVDAMRGLSRTAAYCHAQAGHVLRAATTMEQGCARWLAHALARETTVADRLAAVAPELAARYVQSARDLARVELRAEAHGGIHDGQQRWAEAESARIAAGGARQLFESIVEEIRKLDGFEDFMRPVSLDGVVALLRPDEALAYLVESQLGTGALVVRRRPTDSMPEVHAVWFDSLERDNLAEILGGEASDEPGGFLGGQLHGGTALEAVVGDLLVKLGRDAVGGLAGTLRGLAVRRVWLVTSGLFNLLPLHAATYEHDGQTRSLIDEFCVSFTPSATVMALAHVRAGQRREAPRSLQAITTAQDADPPLVFAEAEVRGVMALFGQDRSTLVVGSAASSEAVLDALQGDGTHLHVACHASFDFEEPLDSALVLAARQRLTLRRLMLEGGQSGARLVVVSGCQTGISAFFTGEDESLSIASALLATGACCVVASLWPVEDLSAAVLMLRFYELLASSHEPAAHEPADALRQAQLWLRGATVAEIEALCARVQALSLAVPDGTQGLVHLSQVRFSLDEPGSVPYAAPYFWAGFAAFGA